MKEIAYFNKKGGVFVTFMVFLSLIISAESVTSVSKTDLLAYFTFDDNDLLGDISQNGRNLTAINTPFRTNNGKINQTYGFTGTDDDKLLMPNTLSLGNTFSVVLWYNRSIFDLQQNLFGNQTIGFDAGCEKVSNGGRFQFKAPGITINSINTTTNKHANCSVTSQNGIYKFVMVTVDGAHSKLFIGNSTNLLNFTGATVGSFPNINGLIIGDNRREDDNSNVNGTIDEFGIWNRTLTDSEVINLWNNGVGISYRDFFEVSNFTITASDSFNGTPILMFNATLYNGTTFNFGTSTGTINTQILNNATDLFNITISANNYSNYYYTNYNLTTNIASSLIYYVSRHNITARDNATNTLIQNFRIIDDGTFNTSTTTYSIVYEHEWNVSSIIYINSTGYEENSHTFNNTNEESFEFNLGQANMFEIRLYDEELNQLITSNVAVELISVDYYTNKTTTSGYVNFTVVTPSAYQIRYYDVAGLYFVRDYYITLSPDSREILKLFLLNKTYPGVVSSNGVVVSVKDTVNTNLENAIVNVNKYFSASNSYETVERLKTNFEGESLSYLVNDEFYRFIVEYNNETVLSTSSTKIFDTTINLVVDLASNPLANFNKWLTLDYSLTFNNNTNTFVFTFNDPDFVTENVCLNVFEKKYTGDVLFNSSCSTSQSGALLVGVMENNGTTYTAKAYANIIGSSTHLLTLKEIKFALSHAFDSGNNGVGIIIMLTLVFVFMGIWSPAVTLILAPIPLIIGSFTGIINIPMAVAGAVFATFIIIVIFIGRRV